MLIDMTDDFAAASAPAPADPANPFAAHGIRHLSPSSCDLFCNEVAHWVYRYLLKYPSAVGAAAHRGSAVETGVVHGLTTGETHEGCARVAMEDFTRRMGLLGDSTTRAKEEAAIPGMVKMGLEALAEYGPPSAVQQKVERRFDGIAVPYLGFSDIVWGDKGIITDLKTLHALPSSIRPSHSRQVAFYWSAINDNFKPTVTYVTGKKAAIYTVEDTQKHLSGLVQVGKAIQRFLAVSTDPRELAGLVMPDTSSFYWSDPQAREHAFEIWGV